MENSKISLSILRQTLAICRLEKTARIPDWVEGDKYFSITKTDDELSIVCSEDRVPNGIKAEKNWRAFKINGPIPFTLTGILASLLNPLAEAKIGIFAISTFDTDYVLVKSENFERAVKVLSESCIVES